MQTGHVGFHLWDEGAVTSSQFLCEGQLDKKMRRYAVLGLGWCNFIVEFPIDLIAACTCYCGNDFREESEPDLKSKLLHFWTPSG